MTDITDAAGAPQPGPGVDVGSDDFGQREGGFVCLHRQILSSGVWSLPDSQRIVFVTLLLVANWKARECMVHGHRVVVKRGQALITIRRLAEKALVSKGVAERALTALRDLEMIRTDPVYEAGQGAGHVPQVITLLNFGKFQDRIGIVRDRRRDTTEDRSRDNGEDRSGDYQNKSNKGDEGDEGESLPPPPASGEESVFDSMLGAFRAEYEREKKTAYVVQGRDRPALNRIIGYANGNVDEVLLRTRRMLREEKILKRRGSSIFDLDQKWNDLTPNSLKCRNPFASNPESGCAGCREEPCVCEVKSELRRPARSPWGSR